MLQWREEYIILPVAFFFKFLNLDLLSQKPSAPEDDDILSLLYPNV